MYTRFMDKWVQRIVMIWAVAGVPQSARAHGGDDKTGLAKLLDQLHTGYEYFVPELIRDQMGLLLGGLVAGLVVALLIKHFHHAEPEED